MKKIHVCLVSDQTIPNILTIHKFRPDGLLFITTEMMEKKQKVSAIMETLRQLGLLYEKEDIQKLVVAENSLLDCHRELERWMDGREDADFIVNLTCGTKIMSIAVYEYFKDYGSRMVYIPIPKNEYIVPFPKKAAALPDPLPLRLSVPQYLTAYGLRITNLPKLQGYKADAASRERLSSYILDNYETLKPLLGFLGDRLRKYRDEREYLLETGFEEATGTEREFFALLGIDYDNHNIRRHFSRSEIGFLTGGWLEEYCYNQVAKVAGIADIVIGLKLMNKQGGDNEFDVMFTSENSLYFIECKSLDQNDDKKADALYKIGALQKEFGLRVQSFLVTTSPYLLKDGKLKSSVRARAEQFNTTVILRDDVPELANKLTERIRRNNG